MAKENYILGLDLGTGSVGWSCVAVDNEQQPKRIIDLNSRIFEPTPSSMEDRRIARGSRRVLRRRRARGNNTKNLFVKYGYLTHEEIKEIYSPGHVMKDPYSLRIKGKKESLDYEELLIVLHQYCKVRGFKSNRKIIDTNKAKDKKSDEGKLLTAISNTNEELEKLRKANPDATITDWILSVRNQNGGKVRNSSAGYHYGITRAEIEEEVRIILEKQISSGVISDSFKDEYLSILLKQRSFSEGPEYGKYSNPIDKMIGTDRLNGNPCASAHSYSYLLFVLVQKLRDIRYRFGHSGKYDSRLTTEQIIEIKDKYLNACKDTITYSLIAEMLGGSVDNPIYFKGEKGPFPKVKSEYDKYVVKSKNTNFAAKYYDLKKHLNNVLGRDYEITPKQYDLIADTFSRRKTDSEIESYLRNPTERASLQEVILSDEIIDALMSYDADYKQFGSLSYETIYQLLPKMIDGGMDYYSARSAVYPESTTGNVTVHSFDEIPAINVVLDELEKTINNSAVTRTLVETRKVVNSIIKRYGKPVAIHIETARDLPLNDEDKKKLILKQDNNYFKNLSKKAEIVEKFSGTGIIRFTTVDQITSEDILRYDLFKRQNGIDPYTLASTGDINAARIKESDVFSAKYEVDHIIPYEMCYDDRKCNKVLVAKKENQNKGKQIPGKYYKDKQGYSKYTAYISDLLTSKRITEETSNRLLAVENVYIGDYRARTINDTRYISKAIREILSFSFGEDVKIRTFTGQQTAKLRSYWRLNNLTTSYESTDYKKISDHSSEEKKYLNDLTSLISEGVGPTEKEYKEVINKLRKAKSESDSKNRSSHIHHAVDATILACMTDKIRRNIEMQEIMYRMGQPESNTLVTVPDSYIVDENGEITDITLKRVDESTIENGLAKYRESSQSKFPQPYVGFTDELKIRACEMDENTMHLKLAALCNNGNKVGYDGTNRKTVEYTESEILSTKPLFISHAYNAKIHGRLHEATYYGLKDDTALVTRANLNSETFKEKEVNAIYDKENTQRYIYQSVSEWLNGYSNGKQAYEAKGYPRNKNGKDIKRVKIIRSTELKEQMELKPGSGIYVKKDDVLQVWIFKRTGDNKLYFCGMDGLRILNFDKKDIPLLLWTGQGKNFLQVNSHELESKGFSLYRIIIPGQTVFITLKNGRSGYAIAGGSSSGIFEIFSITGDNRDLQNSGLINSSSTLRTRLTVSTIDDIIPISVDALGKIH